MVHKAAHRIRHTIRIGGIYYFRMRLPSTTKVLKFSLHTRDSARAAAEAARYAHVIKEASRMDKLNVLKSLTISADGIKADYGNFKTDIEAIRAMVAELKAQGLTPADMFRREREERMEAIATEPVRSQQPLEPLFNTYINHRTTVQHDLKPSSEREVRLSFELYKKYIRTGNLNDITQRLHTDFADFVKSQKANASKIKKKADLKPVSNSTANKHISNINGFFKYLKRKHLTELEPIPLFKKRPETIVKPFPPELVSRIIDDVILKSKSDDAVIFTLCLCTGARVGEIAQLQAQDICLKNGIYVINITENERQTVKNEQSKRYITVPSFLNLWFHKTLESRERTGKSRLFLSITRDAAGTFSGVISKRFAYRFNKISDDKSYKLHSFRHTFITKASTFPEFSAEHIKKITGHKTGEIHHDIYQHQDLEITHKIIETTSKALITKDQINKLITKIGA